MAQTAMSRLFLQSSVRQSILRPAQVRNYGSNAVIPSFTSTPSTELNAALQRFREEVFIPYGLPVRQQKSVFKPKYAKQLEHEPVVVKISETEEYTLTPKKRHELPSKKEAMEVLHMMVSTGEFGNLPAFLAGLKMSGYAVSSNRWEYIIRKASYAGKLPIIAEVARRGPATGLSLADKNIARVLFFELHQTASRASFEGEQTAQALKLAEDFAFMMNQEFHSTKDVTTDPKCQPFVIGTLLELACAKSMDKNAPSEKELAPSAKIGFRIRDYAKKLDASWSLLNKDVEPSTLPELVVRIQENLAIYNGLLLAPQTRKAAEESKTFESRALKLQKTLIPQLQRVKNSQLTSDLVSQQLLRKAPQAKAEAKVEA
ncbi:hypothetical protein N7452_003422 [Penicillium brevicompactum]|uniref:Uncharacterized protein n=1 Tax=Penicillium brevicompactum TaxID=5074 RepID=A0A9W9QVZ2_PENBR|nr:hypothetical protein N7452_003422 [Penicillium brevicompactum]